MVGWSGGWVGGWVVGCWVGGGWVARAGWLVGGLVEVGRSLEEEAS